jgi:D-alanyl-D-alanine carboxypeptidase
MIFSDRQPARRARIAIGALVLVALTGPATAGCPVATRPFPALDAALKDAVADGIPGVSLAVARNGVIIWSGTRGYADVRRHRPVDRTTEFGIGSITKTFVAVVALQLAAEHRLKLNATPASILGKKVASAANADRASLLQLMNHTSGIVSWEDDPRWIRSARGLGADPSRKWRPVDSLSFVDGKPATNDPGAKFAYSNTNYTLLGLAIERVTHRSLAQELRDRIYRPLGLRHIALDGFEKAQPDRASGYHVATKEFLSDAGISPHFSPLSSDMIDVGQANLSAEWAAGAIMSSAEDLACFGSALHDGKLLQPASRRLMFDYREIEDGSEGEGGEVGRGVFRRPAGPKDHLVYHSGGVLGFTAYLGYFDASGTTYALLMNLGTMNAGEGSGNRVLGWAARDHLAALVRAFGTSTPN